MTRSLPSTAARPPFGPSTQDRLAWYAFGLRLFGAGAPLGLVVTLFGPVAFFQGLGVVALAGSLAGFALCRAGMRMEAPLGWPERRAVPSSGLGAPRPPG